MITSLILFNMINIGLSFTLKNIFYEIFGFL